MKKCDVLIIIKIFVLKVNILIYIYKGIIIYK